MSSEQIKAKPRVGFLGVGWIGRHRMAAALATGLIEAAAVADPSSEMVDEALRLAPNAQPVSSLEDMLALDLDAIVIATPSALHAQQAIEALDAGAAVFCQKPLGRTAEEVRDVVAAARKADRLLGVDFSYRFTEGMRHVRGLITRGELGQVFAADLVFHNAYGPDKAWFYDPAQSGGGCMTDLGIHLVDLALWTLGSAEVQDVSGRLFAAGEPLASLENQVEDFGTAVLTLKNGASVRIACSWKLHAGQDAVISASFYGTKAGAALRNIGGSFYDFVAERFDGTQTTTLATPPDEWGGRAIADWARRLAGGNRFSADAEEFVTVSEVLDRIYSRA